MRTLLGCSRECARRRSPIIPSPPKTWAFFMPEGNAMTKPSLLILDKRIHQQVIVREVKRFLATKPLTELLRNWK